MYFFFSSRRRHTRSLCDWSSDVCSSDLDGRELDRVSPRMFPNLISTPDVELEPGPTTTIGWVVPVDDTHHRRFHSMKVPKNLKGRPRQMYTEKRPKPWIEMTEDDRQRHPSDWEA